MTVLSEIHVNAGKVVVVPVFQKTSHHSEPSDGFCMIVKKHHISPDWCSAVVGYPGPHIIIIVIILIIFNLVITFVFNPLDLYYHGIKNNNNTNTVTMALPLRELNQFL